MTNEQFVILSEEYKNIRKKWFNLFRKKVSMDKEIYDCEFNYLLFKTWSKYNKKKNFQRYFLVSLKKLLTTYQRQKTTHKHKAEKKAISIIDTDVVIKDDSMDYLINKDILSYCINKVKDPGVSVLRYKGYTRDEILDKLKITIREYNNIAYKLKTNSVLSNSFLVKDDI